LKTQSEKWFEIFCERAELVCQRIAEEVGKTPDYQLTINGKTIIVEVKEITRNKEEQKSDRLLMQRGYGEGYSNTPGDRVRKKIADASAQIKIKSLGIHPSILVLSDIKNGCGQITGHTDSYNIMVAMYGLEQILMTVPTNNTFSPFTTGRRYYGPKKKMTENQNTSISAIGVLSTPKQDDICLYVYHNVYAANPLDTRLISGFGIRQFQLESKELQPAVRWNEIAK